MFYWTFANFICQFFDFWKQLIIKNLQPPKYTNYKKEEVGGGKLLFNIIFCNTFQLSGMF